MARREREKLLKSVVQDTGHNSTKGRTPVPQVGTRTTLAVFDVRLWQCSMRYREISEIRDISERVEGTSLSRDWFNVYEILIADCNDERLKRQCWRYGFPLDIGTFLLSRTVIRRWPRCIGAVALQSTTGKIFV